MGNGENIERASVMVAMSGGLDSSVAVYLLLQAAYDVCGATMILCEEEEAARKAAEDAKAVCERFGIPHRTIDLRDRFSECVVGPFCDAYLKGATPNPCVMCNKQLKFGVLHQERERLGLDYLATGHYAQIGFEGERWQLLRAADEAKDQSYMLYNMTQGQLKHTLFPLGGLTKREVREVARNLGLECAEAPESQDICFVPDGDYASFIDSRCGGRPAAFAEGNIVDAQGNVLGRHAGLIHYTLGQRKGIGVAAPEPLYVIEKRVAQNELVVGPKKEAVCQSIKVRDVNLIAVPQIEDPMDAQVKTGYRMAPRPAVLQPCGLGEFVVTFREPVPLCARGQAAVFYDGNTVVGGGTIA